MNDALFAAFDVMQETFFDQTVRVAIEETAVMVKEQIAFGFEGVNDRFDVRLGHKLTILVH